MLKAVTRLGISAAADANHVAALRAFAIFKRDRENEHCRLNSDSISRWPWQPITDWRTDIIEVTLALLRTLMTPCSQSIYTEYILCWLS